MQKKAFITGITGQDGSYLAEFLLEKGYEVHGLIRRSSSDRHTWRIDGFKDRISLHEGDVTDSGSLCRAIRAAKPDEVYNLAAQSHVGVSFAAAAYTGEVVAIGTEKLLQACRQEGPKGLRFYQASTSELFGSSPPPQNESTNFRPRSPYAIAKLYAHWATVNARDAYGMHASCGILFNHESPRRGETFVTRKVTLAAARIRAALDRGPHEAAVSGKLEKVKLGNLDAKRDWGHARDYIKGMWRMLQEADPEDYVLATGETHSVQELCEFAFDAVNLDWREWVETDVSFIRPAEVYALCGNAEKARTRLQWAPETRFEDLIREMVESDLRVVRAQAG